MAPLLLRLLATSMARLSQTPSLLSSAYRGLRVLTAARTLPAPSPVNAPASLPASARHEPSLLGRCRHLLPSILPSAGMKTKSALKRRCKDCFFVRRRGRLFVFCKTHPRHKQRQG